MKTKNEPDNKEFRLTCLCHTPLHFIQMNWEKWDNGDEDLNLFFCSDRNWSFWKRVRNAFRYVFGSQDLVMGDIVVSKEKARELAVFLNEVSTDARD